MKIRYITFGSHDINKLDSRAAYNRISLISKGLNSLHLDSEIFEIYSTLFEYKLLKYFGHLKCLIKTFVLLFFAKKDDIIIIYNENPYFFLFKYFQKRTRLFAELLEYPSFLINESLHKKGIFLSRKFEKSLIYFEGIITCSTKLKIYYQKYANDNCKFIILPLILDYNKFSINTFERENYIAYCGDFGNNKDGVPVLIEAFSLISDKYQNYKLLLAGGADDFSVMKAIDDLIHKLNIEEKIKCIGVINHDQMPEFLGKASILALARPNNIQAEGGFPSKIAEYFATGRPVVVTRVGELNLYLTDNVNVFFSDSDKAEDFAKCLDKVLSDYSTAVKVGQSGRNIAESFDFIKQTAVIKDFLLTNKSLK